MTVLAAGALLMTLVDLSSVSNQITEYIHCVVRQMCVQGVCVCVQHLFICCSSAVVVCSCW